MMKKRGRGGSIKRKWKKGIEWEVGEESTTRKKRTNESRNMGRDFGGLE